MPEYWDEFEERLMALGVDKVTTLVEEAIEETKEKFLELLRSQLKAHMTAEGTPITPSYKPNKDGSKSAYELKKGFSVPDLYLEGDFHESIDIIDVGEFIEISSDLVVGEGFKLGIHLEKGTGGVFTGYADIYGLTDDNAEIYTEQYFIPTLTKKIEHALQL